MTPKQSTTKFPFELVYIKVLVFQIELAMAMAKLQQEANDEPIALTRTINQLVELHENKERVWTKLANYQQKMKSMFEEKAKDWPLQPGDLVLWWDVRQE